MMYSKVVAFLFVVLFAKVQSFGIGSTLYCYQCISTHPGCSSPFNWLWHWSQACPETGDTCVKLIERKGANEVVTRDCLSAFKGVRTDIPSDHYEGCRPAAVNMNLGHYVNNSIKELDIKKNFYDETTWCFCSFDNRCNSGTTIKVEKHLIFAAIFTATFSLYFNNLR